MPNIKALVLAVFGKISSDVIQLLIEFKLLEWVFRENQVVVVSRGHEDEQAADLSSKLNRHRKL